MMDFESFQRRHQEDENWDPGQEIINQAFDDLYGDGQVEYFAVLPMAKAIFGGPEYLDAYGVYDSPKGYKHIVTYGMTEIGYVEEAFGKDFNGWGYEMTMKVKHDSDGPPAWAMNLLGNLARYTNESDRYFEPYQYFGSQTPHSIATDVDSLLTALLIVPDTEISGRMSPYGQTDFLQLVGITQAELEAIAADRDKVPVLIEKMQADGNPDLVTDLSRRHSYL